MPSGALGCSVHSRDGAESGRRSSASIRFAEGGHEAFADLFPQFLRLDIRVINDVGQDLVVGAPANGMVISGASRKSAASCSS